MQMRGGGTSQPLYKGGGAGRHAAGRPGPAAPLLGGLGAGRPATGRLVLQGFFVKKNREIFVEKPLEDQSPGSGAAGPPGRPAAGRPALAARL